MEKDKQYSYLCKKAHTVYKIFDKPEACALMQELSNHNRMAPGRLLTISEQTGINYKTLETWRNKLKKNPKYIPEHGHKGVPRKINIEQEEYILNQIKQEFLETNRYCPPRIIKALAKSEFQDLTFGNKWTYGFMSRHSLSSRVPHIKRRTSPNDSHVASFLNSIELINMQFPPDLILNVDETCWSIINGKLHTVAQKGVDDVQIRLKENPKMCLTVIACCSKAGDRLPLWVIVKGKTQLCERKYREDPRLRHHIQSKKVFIDHTENGWSDHNLMIRYIQFLKNIKNGYTFHILWDLHASHKAEDVKSKAAELEVGLTFIPAGQTDEWQPLDRRIFGILKSRARAMFDEQMISKNSEEFDMIDALVILLQSWSLITEGEIISSWKNL